jgi:hypothetical protein
VNAQAIKAAFFFNTLIDAFNSAGKARFDRVA